MLNVRSYIRNNRLHHLTEAGFTVPPHFVDECSSYGLAGTITPPQPQSWLVLIAIGRPDLYRCKRKVEPSPHHAHRLERFVGTARIHGSEVRAHR